MLDLVCALVLCLLLLQEYRALDIYVRFSCMGLEQPEEEAWYLLNADVAKEYRRVLLPSTISTTTAITIYYHYYYQYYYYYNHYYYFHH